MKLLAMLLLAGCSANTEPTPTPDPALQIACENCCAGRMRCTCAGLDPHVSDCPEVTDEACVAACVGAQ